MGRSPEKWTGEVVAEEEEAEEEEEEKMLEV